MKKWIEIDAFFGRKCFKQSSGFFSYTLGKFEFCVKIDKISKGYPLWFFHIIFFHFSKVWLNLAGKTKIDMNIITPVHQRSKSSIYWLLTFLRKIWILSTKNFIIMKKFERNWCIFWSQVLQEVSKQHLLVSKCFRKM